jgi:hypothetical protein
LISGNNDGTIPLSQGHALSNCKIANMDKKNPDPGNSMYDEPNSFYNQYKKNTFFLEPEECLLPGSVNVSTTSFSIFKSGDEQSNISRASNKK